MPAMPRKHGKAKQVVYKILGKPVNMIDKQSAAQKKISEQLLYQETSRVR